LAQDNSEYAEAIDEEVERRWICREHRFKQQMDNCWYLVAVLFFFVYVSKTASSIIASGLMHSFPLP
jgi:hypothetical protein